MPDLSQREHAREKEATVSIHFYSFGPDHTFPNGDPAGGKTVMVDIPDDQKVDPRAMLAGWLRGYDFAFEYTEEEYRQTSMSGKPSIVFAITVESVCGQCQFPESACKCIPQVDWWRDGVVDDDMTDEDGEDYS